MRIAFVGKGGSGKTTLSSSFIRWMKHKNVPVLAIDADLNQHLASAVGSDDSNIRALGLYQGEIKNVLVGSSTYVQADQMIKTTPPSTGSWIADSIFSVRSTLPEFFVEDEKLLIANVGEQQDEDVGIRCYHSKTGVVEMLLNHLVEKEEEVVIVDMVAGADAFASGLYDKFDLTVIVVEPTQKSVNVFKQYANQAEKLGVIVKAVGNKVMDEDDVAYLQDELGDALLGSMTFSSFIRKQERGGLLSIDQLEEENRALLDTIHKILSEQKKDWKSYFDRSVEIHRRNAQSWGNSSKGVDLENQIDLNFQYPA